MRKFYFDVDRFSLHLPAESSLVNVERIALASLFFFFVTTTLNAQKLQFSYSYINLSRNNGGGTLEQGDTIEVHALVKVNSTTNNFYYIDTIRTGTQYIDNSLRLITNEGILFRGPYTNVPLDDNGVYDISNAVPRLRVNIGTGATAPDVGVANFGTTAGGGTVTAGSVPKFYGATLFIVAYRLLVTANYGDTIHLTGNFFLDTSGINTSYRFDYAGIKIIQNQALCNNFSGASFSADSSFASGTSQNRALPAIVPGYIKVNMGANAPQDNYYAIANNTSSNGTTNNAGPYVPTANANRVFNGFWDIIGDHTGAVNTAAGNPPTPAGQSGGYMLVVNAAYPTGEAYHDTIKNVCPNTYYEFSAWIRNICGVCSIDSNSAQKYTPGVLPNLSYTINDIDYFTTGTIAYDRTWVKRGFIYKTGPTESQFVITIKNNAAGGGGNDWVLDDIKLATCYPNLVMNPSDTSTSCAGFPVVLSDTVKSFFNNYTYWCWEKSDDGITWNSTGVCGVKNPVIVNGLWQYVTDTVFTAVAADSGKYYRLKVATAFTNLSNPNCAVSNSQKIFLKIYNLDCKVLNNKILNFYGDVINEKAYLYWKSQRQDRPNEFEIERSPDGINFKKVGRVIAIDEDRGASYSFYDPENISFNTYYRLKAVSQSSKENYSKIILLHNKNAALKINVINPFKSDLKIDICIPEDGAVKFSLRDIYGRVVMKKSTQLKKGTSHLLLTDTNLLPPGLYILKSYFNNITTQNKLLKRN